MNQETLSHRHFKLYKPAQYLSQFIYEQKRQKKLLGELYDFPKSTMAVGRLDENSEGLLLLTTDGKLSHYILSGKVEKEYYVQVDGNITEDAIDEIKRGVVIGFHGKKYKTLPCEARRLDEEPRLPNGWKVRDDRHGPTSWARITIREGKYRQVRKMTAAVGFPTLRLVRMRVGKEHLDNLLPGQVEEVDEFNL